MASTRYIITNSIGESKSKIRMLPPEIQKGINPEVAKQLIKDVETTFLSYFELRKGWNRPAPEEFGLPTEIWREVVHRP